MSTKKVNTAVGSINDIAEMKRTGGVKLPVLVVRLKLWAKATTWPILGIYDNLKHCVVIRARVRNPYLRAYLFG